ncbi:Putative major facilitator, sugar transporter, major facilitator superfamily [Colletotrichum destructivum]|uniref:Major facilitator, sugar transporter, major facilitator superfamily n=1 Tax=Colletotrichum destructivum TaxID=34406 RepID=A0AAX4IJE0_9PEZI|nr:Putative major facilitator, sugar transporter, major facilitator superfamily [Colletotrichum destructivum]
MAPKDIETIAVASALRRGVEDTALAEAIRLEHNLSFSQAIRLYPTAIGWSAFVSLGVIMLAFDPQLLGNLYATPQFQRDFGYEYEGSYIISAAWQTGLSMGNPIGQVIGALFAAYPMDWLGRKLTFATCVVLTAGIVSIQFLARSLPVLLVGELLGGLVLGMFVVIAPAYASEVCPTALRGHLTSYVNLCFVMGQLLANGVTAGTSKLNTHWAYSLPFSLQWLWILVILPGLLFVPESPWWLVRKGRLADAETSLRRLASKDSMPPPHWRSSLRPTGLSKSWKQAVLSGIYLINYGTYFFQQAGLPTDKAFEMAIGFLAVGFLGTVMSWYFLLHYGRRTIYITGLAALIVLQLLIGVLDCVPGRPKGVAWAESSLMLIWNFAYDLSVGPICFVLISEASATRLRSKTIALATAAQGVIGIIMTVAIPYMINPDEANMQGKLGFFFGGLACLCFIWAWFRVPETKGRTYEELDILFEQRVPARDFKSHIIESMTCPGHRSPL